jgi:hypothetical protein
VVPKAKVRAPATSLFTSDFHVEYEAERERWLRRRFLWYTGVVSALNIVPLLVGVLVLAFARTELGNSEYNAALLGFGSGAVSAIPYVWTFFYARARRLKRDQLLFIAYGLIIFSGILELLTPVAVRSLVKDPTLTSIPVGIDLTNIFVAHFLACLFLPWTPRESLKPVVPLLVLNAFLTLFTGQSAAVKFAVIALSPLIAAPGSLICWWRYSRFRDRFTLNQLRGRYAELRQELISARQIHEALFPAPIADGPVRFSYSYEPMRQIGGDYLYAKQIRTATGDPLLHVVLVDVTGHGIPAALTVNRLHGELDRIFGESPAIGPGEVLTLLNRYVHHTLATHSVYVTAICFRVDPARDRLEYASGGHPPAFLKAVDGSLEQLDSTGLVLGATAGPDFEAAPRTLRFGPGDVLVAYTDGATEARDAQGRYLGIAALQHVIALESPASGSWPALITQTVDRHRHGPIADDTLVIEIARPLVSDPVALTSGARPTAMTAGA